MCGLVVSNPADSADPAELCRITSSLLPTCLIAMDFNDNDDAEFDAAAGAILAITSATATAITTSILPILMELNNSLSSEKDGEDNKQPRLQRAVTPLYKAPVKYKAISFLLKFKHLSNSNCIEYSNFTKAQIIKLTNLLHINQVIFYNRYTAYPITTFCVLL